MKVYKCDICKKIKACKQYQIEGKDFDLCDGCWEPLKKKLGKGRVADKITPSYPWERPYWVHPWTYPPYYNDGTWIGSPVPGTFTICGTSSAPADTSNNDPMSLIGMISE